MKRMRIDHSTARDGVRRLAAVDASEMAVFPVAEWVPTLPTTGSP